MIRLIRHAAAPDHLDVHLLDLDADDTPIEDAERLLDPGELARARRLSQPSDRRRFLLRRMHVRLRLGLWLGREPSAVGIAYGAEGKPYVADAEGGFSAAHSHGRLLIVMNPRGVVGCDLERIDAGFDWRAAMEAQVLTAGEADRLARQTGPTLLFETWTLKEACLKCSGEGLSVPGRLVDTSAVGPDTSGSARFHAATLPLQSYYAAAVAWSA